MSVTRVHIAAGTSNPAKLEAIRRAAEEILGDVPVESVEVDPDVPVQPWGDEETAHGALMRARNALAASPDATFGVGVESGLTDGPGDRIYVLSWAAAIDRSGAVGYGASERFPVPAGLEAELRCGAELGPLLDRLLDNPGLARREGVVSVITEGRRQRADILTVAVLHSLIALLKGWEPSSLA